MLKYGKSEYLFGPQAVSFVERSTIHCPYLRGSTIRGSTVYRWCLIYYTLSSHRSQHKTLNIEAVNMKLATLILKEVMTYLTMYRLYVCVHRLF